MSAMQNVQQSVEAYLISMECHGALRAGLLVTNVSLVMNNNQSF